MSNVEKSNFMKKRETQLSESFYPSSYINTSNKLSGPLAKYFNLDNLKRNNYQGGYITPINELPRRRLSMMFDGENLDVYNHLVNEFGQVIESDTLRVPAYSGKNLNGYFESDNPQFDYSKDSQMKSDSGPIPEGIYKINPKAIQYRKDARVIDPLLGMFYRGRWPGGERSWGKGRIDISPNKVQVNGVERGGFTIHGGTYPGSKGCIDLLDMDEDLFNYLERYSGNLNEIELKVDYSNINKNK